MWDFLQLPWLRGAARDAPASGPSSHDEDIEMTELAGEMGLNGETSGAGAMCLGENYRTRNKRKAEEAEVMRQSKEQSTLQEAAIAASLLAANPIAFLAQESGIVPPILRNPPSQAAAIEMIPVDHVDHLHKRLESRLAAQVDVVYASHMLRFGKEQKKKVTEHAAFASQVVSCIHELGDEAKQLAALKALFLLLKAEDLGGPLALAVSFMAELEMKQAAKQVKGRHFLPGHFGRDPVAAPER